MNSIDCCGLTGKKGLRVMVGAVLNGDVGNTNVFSHSWAALGQINMHTKACARTQAPTVTYLHCLCVLCVCMSACVKPCVFAYLFFISIHLPFPPQLSSVWCAIGCVRTTGAGALGLTSVFPADISDGAAPALSPATSLMGEQSIRPFPLFLLLKFWSNV